MFTRSEVIVLTNKHTNTHANRRRWKHPTLFITLRRWVKWWRMMWHIDHICLTPQSAHFHSVDSTVFLLRNYRTWRDGRTSDFCCRLHYIAGAFNSELSGNVLFVVYETHVAVTEKNDKRKIFRTNTDFICTEVRLAATPRRRLTLSPPIPLRLYTLPYWSNPPFLIFDIRVLWRSGLSARAPECQKLKMVG